MAELEPITIQIEDSQKKPTKVTRTEGSLSRYSEKMSMAQNKAIALFAARTIAKEVSAQAQISGNYILQNQAQVATNVVSSAAIMLAAGMVGGTSGAMMALGQVYSMGAKNRAVLIEYSKNEQINNNLRQKVGLEATNYSRYGGKKR